MGSITQSNGHCTSKINKRVQSGVPCARRIAATVKVEGLQDDSETCVSCVMFEDGGTNKKTGGQVRGCTAEDVCLLEMSPSEGQLRLNGLETKLKSHRVSWSG